MDSSSAFAATGWAGTLRRQQDEALAALDAAWAQVSRRAWVVLPPGADYHAVPSVLDGNAERADAFARAWSRWVSRSDALYAGSPEGAGVLAAQRGADPFDVTTVLRLGWH